MITMDELRKMLRDACEAEGSQTAWAAKNGVSLAYVNDVLAGRRNPGEGISKAFGLKPITVYVQADQKPRERKGKK